MKRVLVLLTLVLVAGSLAAFDWGGYLDNTTGIANPKSGDPNPVAIIQNTKLALWANVKLGGWTLDGQGSYTFTPNVPVLLDIDRLTIGTDVIASEAGATTVGLTLGRNRFRDTTGVVLNHTLDGLRLQINQQNGSFSVEAGTSALLLKPANYILLSEVRPFELDSFAALSQPDYLDAQDPRVYLAPPRLIVDFEYRLLEVFAAQHLSLGATIQEDLRPQSELTPEGTTTSSPDDGGRVDTQYVTVGLAGGIIPGLFHRTSYTLNSGRRLEYVTDSRSPTNQWWLYQAFVGHMINGELTYFLPEVLNSRARLFGLFSTGDSSWADRFVPLSLSAYSDVFTLQPGNSAHLGVSYSARPLAALGLDILQTELKSVIYFRSTGGGAVSEPSVDPTSTGAYVGTDLNLIVTAVPLSDLRLVLKGGVFVPNASVRTAGNQNVDYQVTLQGVLRF